ncbi:MAG TPA: hypothetical protein VFQ77_06250 [Pseudonocardiaceae bacterium]|jgi:hypothetical protein|nr:hypothetical protein [Pseudonocardiaceae bacterium]
MSEVVEVHEVDEVDAPRLVDFGDLTGPVRRLAGDRLRNCA